jgi:hypothetical protein
MTRRKIIAQTMIGSETRPIKAKLRNASCLWDTHQGDLWVLDFIRRSPPCPRNIVQHDCENVNDQRRIHRPPQTFSTENSPSRSEFGLSSRLIRRNGARFCPVREIENSGNSTTSLSNTISVPGSPADYTFCGFGSQMLILRVSGIRNRLSTKHTAGTAIG